MRDPLEAAKRHAGYEAAEYVEDGMVIGLGSGSTVYHALAAISAKVRQGLNIRGVPSSRQTERWARRLGIPLTTLDEHPELDLTIDGADEVDPNLNLIKGRGGALVREKILAYASRRLIIVVDWTKLVPVLGTRTELPVEVVPFGWKRVELALAEFGCQPRLRFRGDRPYRSDNGNFIIDCRFSEIREPYALEADIKRLPGVVDCGLFLGLTSLVIIGEPAGFRVLSP
jgi:ribose 5-phosphate isomerase A